MPRGYSFDRSSSGSLAMLAGMRRASSRINAPHAPVCDASHGEAPPIMVRLPTGGAPMKKLLLCFALVFAVVAGTATVLTVVTPQSAIADPCPGGTC